MGAPSLSKSHFCISSTLPIFSKIIFAVSVARVIVENITREYGSANAFRRSPVKAACSRPDDNNVRKNHDHSNKKKKKKSIIIDLVHNRVFTPTLITAIVSEI